MLHVTPQMQMSPGGAGGEKRRLSIACALIARPSLLFLDEPTTGLDSFAALNVMEHLSSLAALGHTVVASIHQPRSAIWDMFHKMGASALEDCCVRHGTPFAQTALNLDGSKPATASAAVRGELCGRCNRRHAVLTVLLGKTQIRA